MRFSKPILYLLILGLLMLPTWLIRTNADMQATVIVTFTCCVYEPETVLLAAGDTVQWDGSFVEHPLVSEDDLWPEQSSGSSFSFTFTDPGIYDYYCTLHGAPGGVGMSGRVIVGTHTYLPLVINGDQ